MFCTICQLRLEPGEWHCFRCAGGLPNFRLAEQELLLRLEVEEAAECRARLTGTVVEWQRQ